MNPEAVERLPEAVPGPCEVMPDGARPQPGVDPDEDDVEVRPEDVGDRPVARGFQVFLRRAHGIGRAGGRRAAIRTGMWSPR